MIIICEACQKKYRINETKIRGNHAKIRCKQCNQIIHIQLPPQNKLPEKSLNNLSKPTYQEKDINHLLTNQTKQIDDITVIRLPFDTLDVTNIDMLKKYVFPFVLTFKKVIINMIDVQYLDSSGCGGLVYCVRKQTERKGSIAICNLSDTVKGIFELIQLQRICHLFDSCENAIASGLQQS